MAKVHITVDRFLRKDFVLPDTPCANDNRPLKSGTAHIALKDGVEIAIGPNCAKSIAAAQGINLKGLPDRTGKYKSLLDGREGKAVFNPLAQDQRGKKEGNSLKQRAINYIEICRGLADKGMGRNAVAIPSVMRQKYFHKPVTSLSDDDVKQVNRVEHYQQADLRLLYALVSQMDLLRGECVKYMARHNVVADRIKPSHMARLREIPQNKRTRLQHIVYNHSAIDDMLSRNFARAASPKITERQYKLLYMTMRHLKEENMRKFPKKFLSRAVFADVIKPSQPRPVNRQLGLKFQ